MALPSLMTWAGTNVLTVMDMTPCLAMHLLLVHIRDESLDALCLVKPVPLAICESVKMAMKVQMG